MAVDEIDAVAFGGRRCAFPPYDGWLDTGQNNAGMTAH